MCRILPKLFFAFQRMVVIDCDWCCKNLLEPELPSINSNKKRKFRAVLRRTLSSSYHNENSIDFIMSQQTHSLSQRRAVPGRRKRFDTLLAEHKNRTRERERERELHQNHSQQNPPLRDPHPSSHLTSGHDAHQVAHGNGPALDATKPLPIGKPKFHSPGLPR